MKLKNIIVVSGIVLLLTGCASLQPRATVADGTIQNTSLGFSGFTFKIPDGYAVYNPAEVTSAGYNELQRMAIRIYELNREWHPRDDELFYESFLLMSEQTCFLLITVKSGGMVLRDDAPFSERPVSTWQLMPVYNATAKRTFELGLNRLPATYASGYAYEKKGWYYANPKSNSMSFNFEVCKVTGGNRDSYILMGFALPDNAGALTAPMKQMMDDLRL